MRSFQTSKWRRIRTCLLGAFVGLGFSLITYLEARKSGISMPFIAGSALFILIGGYLIWHGVFLQNVFVIDDHGLAVVRGDRTVKRLAWEEIERVQALQRSSILHLQGRSGITIDVPYSVEGLDELADEVSRRSGCAIEPRTG